MVNTRANKYDREEVGPRKVTHSPLGSEDPQDQIFSDHNMVPHAGPSGHERGRGEYVSPKEEDYFSAVSSEGEAGEGPAPCSIPRDSPNDEGKMNITRILSRAAPKEENVTRQVPQVVFRDRPREEHFEVDSTKWDRSRRKLPVLPLLHILIALPRHLDLCEAILEEEDWDLNLLKCKAAVIQTFTRFEDLHSTATTLIGMTWVVMRKVLIEGFCDPNFQRKELERQLQALKFSEEQMMQFTHAVRRIHSLTTPELNLKWFIERVFEAIPRYVSRDVIVRLRAINPALDWTSHDFETIVDVLGDVIASLSALNSIKPVERRTPTDRSRQTRENGGNIRDWITKHEGKLFYVSKLAPDALASLSDQAEEIKTLKRRKDGEAYHLVLFKNEAQGHAVLAGMLAERDFHRYTAAPKNS